MVFEWRFIGHSQLYFAHNTLHTCDGSQRKWKRRANISFYFSFSSVRTEVPNSIPQSNGRFVYFTVAPWLTYTSARKNPIHSWFTSFRAGIQNPCDIYDSISGSKAKITIITYQKICSRKIDGNQKCPCSMFNFHRFIFITIKRAFQGLKVFVSLSSGNAYE